MANQPEERLPMDGTPNSFVSAVSELNNEDTSNHPAADPARNARILNENDPSPLQPRVIFHVDGADGVNDVPHYLRRHANLRSVVDVEAAEDELNEDLLVRLLSTVIDACY